MKNYKNAVIVSALLGGAAILLPSFAQAGLISAVLVGDASAPYSYNLTIEFANGNYYDYTLRSTQATISGETLINMVDAARPEVMVDQTSYSFGDAVNGITIGTDSATGFVNNRYWAYWNTDPANPAQWTFANDGESARMLTPGQSDGWVYSDGSHAPQQATTFPAVPEPAAWAWVVLCSRRLGVGTDGPAQARFVPGAGLSMTTRAFTLVELLVVIAVAAVLTAVALPVYQSVRVSSSQVVALSALRQLSMAGNLYLGDNQQKFWPFRSDDAAGTTYWFGYETSADARLPEGSRTIDYSRGALGPYSGGMHDVHPDPQFTRMGAAFKPKFKNGYIPYGYNDLLQGQSTATIPDDTKRVVFATSAQVNTFQPPATSAHPMLEEFYMVDDFNVTASFRYHEQALCAFADGSTGFLPAKPNSLDSRLPDSGVGKLPTENLK